MKVGVGCGQERGQQIQRPLVDHPHAPRSELGCDGVEPAVKLSSGTYGPPISASGRTARDRAAVCFHRSMYSAVFQLSP